MSHSIICQKEVKSLLENIEPLLYDVISRSAESDADFHTVEEAIKEFITALRPIVVSSGLKTSITCSSHDYNCPECGLSLTTWGKSKRHFVTSQGSADVSVVRYRCISCASDYYPVVEANGLKGTRFTLGARERIVSKAADDPYADVSDDLPELGITVSAKEVDRQVRQAYEYYKVPLAQEIQWYRNQQENDIASVLLCDVEQVQFPGVGKPQPLFNWSGWDSVRWMEISTDGGMVRSPERDENGKLKWFEERSGLIRAFEPTQEDGKRLRLDAKPFHAAGVMTLDDIFDWLYAVWKQRPSNVENFVFISDDGQGHFSRARQYFSDAIIMLDIYHASQHVSSGADALWGTESELAKQFKEQSLSLLKEEGGVQRILRLFIKAMRDSRSETDIKVKLADAEGLIRQFRYLWRNRHLMKYALWDSMGLIIGSGAMESCVKQTCVKRLRQPGMMWTKEGANAMLHLRSAHLSGCLNTVFKLQRDEQRDKLNKFRFNYKDTHTHKLAV